MDHANRLDGKSAASCDPAHATAAAGCGIAFMAKASAPGRAKTRLVPPLTFEEAAVLNTAFLQDVADNVLLAARDAERHGGIAGYAAYGPPGSEDFFSRTLPGGIGLIEAWRQNLAIACCIRSRRFLPADTRPPWCTIPTARHCRRRSWSRPRRRWRGRATVPARSVERRRLLSARAEGRPSPHVRHIAWSTEQEENKRLNGREIGLDVHRLPVWYDVDDVDGLRRLRAELSPDAQRRRPGKNQPHHAVHTAALMNSLWQNHEFNRRAAALVEAEPLRA